MKANSNGPTGMGRGRGATIAAALIVTGMSMGGCDLFKEEPPAATQAAASGRKGASSGRQASGKSVNQPVEDAMMGIPPELRASYRQAFICEVKRAKAANKAVQVTPAYVQDLTRRLKADPKLARC